MLRMEGRVGVTALLIAISISTHFVLFTEGLGRMGINYGTLGDNLASPNDTLTKISTCVFRDLRIYDTNPDILRVIPQGVFGVVVGTFDNDLASFASDPNFAANWVSAQIYPFADLPIRGIVVGNEVIPGPLAQHVPGAMRNLRQALDARGLTGIYVTTSLFGRTVNGFPPSASVFGDDSIAVMKEVVAFMNGVAEVSRGPIFANVYPYYPYISDPQHVALDYAVFRAGAKPVQDGLLTYTNLFDAMFDGFMWAMEKIGGEGIEIVVGETGWPSGGNGDFATPAIATEYNTNLYNHITTLGGSPRGWQTQKLWPKLALVFSLFNEDKKPAGAEQFWGLFNPDLTPAYTTPMCPS